MASKSPFHKLTPKPSPNRLILGEGRGTPVRTLRSVSPAKNISRRLQNGEMKLDIYNEYVNNGFIDNRKDMYARVMFKSLCNAVLLNRPIDLILSLLSEIDFAYILLDDIPKIMLVDMPSTSCMNVGLKAFLFNFIIDTSDFKPVHALRYSFEDIEKCLSVLGRDDFEDVCIWIHSIQSKMHSDSYLSIVAIVEQCIKQRTVARRLSFST